MKYGEKNKIYLNYYLGTKADLSLNTQTIYIQYHPLEAQTLLSVKSLLKSFTNICTF